jgi:hypothetical protein
MDRGKTPASKILQAMSADIIFIGTGTLKHSDCAAALNPSFQHLKKGFQFVSRSSDETSI